MQPSARGMLLLWDRLVRRSGLIPARLAWSHRPPPRGYASVCDVVAGGSVIPGGPF